MPKKINDYWRIRARRYNKLKWVQDEKAINKLIKFCNITLSNSILDVGCGTGIVTEKLCPYVLSRIYAIDKSKAMLSKARKNRKIKYFIHNIENKLNDKFDRIIFRMTMHHINDVPKVFKNCYEMLYKYGELIIEERGIIPIKYKKVSEWHNAMMDKKEKRNNFTLPQLVEYFEKAGFRSIKKIVGTYSFSINDWLDNSGQSKSLRKEIYDIHYNAPDYVKKFYNMKIRRGSITIDSPFLLIKGVKG